MKLVKILLFIALSASSLSWASVFLNGTFKVTNGVPYLIKYNLEKVPLKIYSFDVFNQLSILEQNDYIFITATQGRNREAAVESVDFVGLQRLLGSWLGKNYIWNFQNYSNLLLTPRITMRDQEPIKLSYSITPNEDSTFTILISNPKFVKIGTLRIFKSQIYLEFEDPADATTNEILNETVLTRINEYK